VGVGGAALSGQVLVHILSALGTGGANCDARPPSAEALAP
jgi:hypothetical protein